MNNSTCPILPRRAPSGLHSPVPKAASNMSCSAAIKASVALACLSMSPTSWAADATSLGNAAITAPIGGSNQVAPFQYIPGEKWKDLDPSEVIKRSGEPMRIAEMYKAGNYAETGTAGLALISKEKVDEQLQLYIANSLAWTNRLKEAGQLYRVLIEGKYKMSAMLGLANLNRWQGRDHLSAPMYKQILAVDPTNKDALEGLRLTDREMKPKTTVTIGGSNDSSDIQLRTLKINHRWRDPSGANIWEVETTRVRNNNLVTEVQRQDFAVRYKMLETPFKPRLELGTDGQKVYGSAGVELGTLPVLVEVGRVNWGLLSSNPAALAANLSATRLGVQGSTSLAAGSLFGRADFYNISDGNTITTSALRFTPSWRPLGSHFKPLLGIETRNAKFNTLNYWSPSDGYGSATAGVMGEWGEPDWNFFASAQVGARLFGEAGRSWSLSSGGKRWLNKDWAVGMNFWAMGSQRDNLPYRARSLYFTVEKLWP
jgi:hypothetical protein